MGPGISSVGCSGWLDIFADRCFSSFGGGLGGDLVTGIYSISSDFSEFLSVENGVLMIKEGLCSRCLEMTLNRERGEARAK